MGTTYLAGRDVRELLRDYMLGLFVGELLEHGPLHERTEEQLGRIDWMLDNLECEFARRESVTQQVLERCR